MLFQWLRTSVKNAVLGGIADALSEIGDAPADAGNALVQLRQRLAVALPAPASSDDTAGKAAGVPQDATSSDIGTRVAPAAGPHRNGRRRVTTATA